MTDRISPALTPEEWVGVQEGTVGIVGTPNAKANHQVAAVCLYGQPFGFTRADVELLRAAGNRFGGTPCVELWRVADRIAALLPPETPV